MGLLIAPAFRAVIYFKSAHTCGSTIHIPIRYLIQQTLFCNRLCAWKEEESLGVLITYKVRSCCV